MTRSIVRIAAPKIIGLLAGVVVGVAIALVYLAFNPQGEQPVDIVTQAPSDPQVMTTGEAHEWLTPDCEIPAEWNNDTIPASAIVRDATSTSVSRINFADAFAAAESGSVWTLALCGQPTM